MPELNQNRKPVAKNIGLSGSAIKAMLIKTHLNSQYQMIKKWRCHLAITWSFYSLYGTLSSHLFEVKYELFITIVLPLDRLALKVSGHFVIKNIKHNRIILKKLLAQK